MLPIQDSKIGICFRLASNFSPPTPSLHFKYSCIRVEPRLSNRYTNYSVSLLYIILFHTTPLITTLEFFEH